MDTRSSLWSTLVDIVETVVVAAAIFVVVYLFLLQPHQVKGASMEPNFRDGEYILTDKISYRFSEPRRGDVVIFKAPTNPDVDFIKRIVALPGEKLEVKNNKIIIFNDENPKGFTLSEPYQVMEPIAGGTYLREGKIVEVPADNYLVFGDNRTHSFDSREWGPLPRKSIIGKSWLRYWPLSKISIIKRPQFP
ncbi:MAG: signal peptidase I [Candidatus Woykebacteria bacterium RBG_19FT_COMBO_43_10]|uniref:Signal peptidase I n=1 Tax=Candidatus Woykebacteria bacterium RBG_19FT_COMBO_43_10 TaxID=1802598 RepID=A0A1G1WMB3_9BACT|nr:MAG: signal peptidase I [Candidatus Woykebacteria bacterium RBG_19FT_COMBO_43_10]